MDTLKDGVSAYVEALQGKPPRPFTLSPVSEDAIESVGKVLSIHKDFWNSLLPVLLIPMRTVSTTGSLSGNGNDIQSSVAEFHGLPPGVAEDAEEMGIPVGKTSERTPDKGDIPLCSVPKEDSAKSSSGNGNDVQSSVAEFLGLPPGVAEDAEELFAVEPLAYCPHLMEVNPIPSTGINVLEPCLECENVGENWICLSCYKV